MTNSTDDMGFLVKPIGVIRTPFADKFAVPRQPGLAPHAKAVIEFYPPYDDEQAFVGIDGFSHLHILFVFDRIDYTKFRARVRPPRLGGNISMGVFATRSPFRPNRIGLSVVKINKVIREKGKVKIEVSGADLVDSTPILDIKPYIPFVDSIESAKGGFASTKPKCLNVQFSDCALEFLKNENSVDLKAVEEILSQDPRPAYKDIHDKKEYSATLYGFIFRFTVDGDILCVNSVMKNGDEHEEEV